MARRPRLRLYFQRQECQLGEPERFLRQGASRRGLGGSFPALSTRRLRIDGHPFSPVAECAKHFGTERCPVDSQREAFLPLDTRGRIPSSEFVSSQVSFGLFHVFLGPHRLAGDHQYGPSVRQFSSGLVVLWGAHDHHGAILFPQLLAVGVGGGQIRILERLDD